MSSFFEKLKKGMGIEAPLEEEEEIKEKPPKENLRFPTGQAKRKRGPKTKKSEITARPIEPMVKKIELEKPDIKKNEMEEEKVEITFTPPKVPEKLSPAIPEVPVKEEERAQASALEDKEKWFEQEGELAIDVYQTETNLVIQTAIAGVKPENLDISMERDVIAIKGARQKPFEEEGDYFTQECFWGLFSREIILPVEVDPDRAEATMKDGILTIRIPKILREKKRIIKVRI